MATAPLGDRRAALEFGREVLRPYEGELVKLQERLGVTTLYVTHDQTEAMTLGQAVGLATDASWIHLFDPETGATLQ